MQEVVYMGNDVMVHACLEGGYRLRARLAVSSEASPSLQQCVGLEVPPDAVKVFAA